MSDCVKRIVELSEDKTTVKEAKEILKALEQSRGALDFEDNVLQRAIEMRDEVARSAALQKRNAQLNILKKQEVKNKIDLFIEDGLTLNESIRALLLGTQANISNGRRSVASRQDGLVTEYMGGVIAALEKEQLLPFLNSKDMHQSIARELWELSQGKSGGVSKIPEAAKIAKIFATFQNNLKDRLNRAGADIRDLDERITNQSHDQYKIKKAGYKQWKQDIAGKIAEERTFKGFEDKEKYLRGVYDAFVTGVHLRPDVDEGELFGFKGPANLAKRLSRSRKIHFKSADDWFEYNEKYGTRDVVESIMGSIEYGARNVGLMESLGTNPRAMFDTVYQEAKENYRSNEKAMKGLSDDATERAFVQLDGTVHIANNPTGGMVGSIVRGVQTMSKLGGAVISAVSDIPLQAFEYQHQGKSYLESRTLAYKSVFQGRGSTVRKQIAARIGVGIDGMIGAISARFSANDNPPGIISKGIRQFFKWNGLQWWTDTMKMSVGLTMSNDLAAFKNKSFTDLPDHHKQMFDAYEIGEKEWDIIRKNGVELAEDGREYVLADVIDIEDERLRDEVATKLQSYYTDRINHAVLTPDAREQSVLNLGLQRGTIAGEAIRALMQFKAFPVTFVNKVIGRTAYKRGNKDIAMLAALMAEMTVMGYIAMATKDILKGREPRDPLDRKTIAAAFVQGGGAGIYGDFLFGEYNRFGGGGLEALAGPTVGATSDLLRTFAKIRDGEDAGASALRTIQSNTPFANMFYTKPALDYLFTYQIQEAMNPGYLRRMERRIKKENNQEFWLKPSNVVD